MYNKKFYKYSQATRDGDHQQKSAFFNIEENNRRFPLLANSSKRLFYLQSAKKSIESPKREKKKEGEKEIYVGTRRCYLCYREEEKKNQLITCVKSFADREWRKIKYLIII